MKEAFKNPANLSMRNEQSQELLGTQSLMRKKIKIIKWLSKKIGEYDINNQYWQTNDA